MVAGGGGGANADCMSEGGASGQNGDNSIRPTSVVSGFGASQAGPGPAYCAGASNTQCGLAGSNNVGGAGYGGGGGGGYYGGGGACCAGGGGSSYAIASATSVTYTTGAGWLTERRLHLSATNNDTHDNTHENTYENTDCLTNIRPHYNT
eukprot:gene44047-54735_t